MMQKINPILISGDNNDLNIRKLENIPLPKSEGGFQETLLQELIHKAPYTLPIKEYYPSATSVFSLGREIPVQLGGGRIGYIDNLLITNDGHLVLVETKLSRNPEAIREVIAQTLEYGMALNQLAILGIEAVLKSTEKRFRVLDGDDTIYGILVNGNMPSINADFENTFEKFLRTGEMLYLIVADGIHVGVDRLTSWLNEKSTSAPYKFGLVELKFFELPDKQRIVIPKALLKTSEISRHVVVVDVRNPNISAEIETKVVNASGGVASSKNKAQSPASLTTKSSLLATMKTDEDRAIASSLIVQLESAGLSSRSLEKTLQYGFYYPDNSGEFYQLISLQYSILWIAPPKKLRELLGDDWAINYKKRSNEIADFYPVENINDPNNFNGRNPYYKELEPKIPELTSLLISTKDAAFNAMES